MEVAGEGGEGEGEGGRGLESEGVDVSRGCAGVGSGTARAAGGGGLGAAGVPPLFSQRRRGPQGASSCGGGPGSGPGEGTARLQSLSPAPRSGPLKCLDEPQRPVVAVPKGR